MASKNMVIRLGVDASDFKKKMKQAGVDAENAGKKIKRNLTMSEIGSEVRSIMGWGSSSSGIMGSINVGNFDAAKSQLSILKSYRDQLADAGFDDYQFGLVSERIKVLEYELNAYEESLRRVAEAEKEAAAIAKAEADAKAAKEKAGALAFEQAIQRKQQSLKDFEQATSRISRSVSDIMGWSYYPTEQINVITSRNVNTAQKQLATLREYLRALQDFSPVGKETEVATVSGKILSLEFALNSYEKTLRRTADAEREAAGAAGNLGNQAHQTSIPVSKASRELREMSSSGRKLSIIPGFLRRVRDSADSSNSRLEKMVRSIRNISVVSFGLRLVRGLFGELGTIVRQHVAQDAALQAQVDTLKASFGQSLAPAINIATNALSAMMPYIIGVSDAISTLISALAGPGWTTVSSGASAAAKAIGGAGGAQEKFNRSLQGFDEITKLDSKSSGGGGGGGSTTEAAPVEGKLPEWMTGIVDQLSEAISEGDWAKVGNVLAKGFSDTVSNIDWAGAFSKVGSFLGGVGAAIWGAVGDSLTKHWDEFWRVTNDFGGDIVAGLFYGIGVAINKVGTWLKENFLNPMIEGFKDTFKIHSPSQHPDIIAIGKNIMLGIKNAMLQPFKNIGAWIKTNIATPLVNALKKIFGEDTQLGKAVSEWLLGNENWHIEVDAELADVDATKISGLSVEATAQLKKAENNIPKKYTMFDATVRFTDAKNSLNASDTTIAGAVRLDKSVNNLNASDTTVGGTVQFFKSADKLNSAAKTIAGTVMYSAAINSLSIAQKTIGTKARFMSSEDGLSDSDKKLSVKAVVTKGWAGDLAAHLGIAEITSKLKLKLPTVSVTWDTSVAPNGKGEAARPTYTAKYNALGAIFTGASLLGRVGNDWQIAGEAGREVLLNVDRHTWWMDSIADRVEARIGGSAVGGDRPIQVNLVVDGKVLANTVVRNVNAQARATGKNPLAAYI